MRKITSTPVNGAGSAPDGGRGSGCGRGIKHGGRDGCAHNRGVGKEEDSEVVAEDLAADSVVEATETEAAGAGVEIIICRA